MTLQESADNHPIIIFGGNGFVGTEIARQLTAQGIKAIAVSRKGTMPAHLQQGNEQWPQQVDWRCGDATQPHDDLPTDAQAVICLVGSPPVPTFSQSAFEQQLYNNAVPNCKAIEWAQQKGIQHIVLLAAHLPAVLQRDGFGYYLGKQRSIEAAKSFANTSAQHSAAVLMPSGIYGKRHTTSGKAIPLDCVMKPIAKLQQVLPAAIKPYLPETLVAVQSVAAAAVAAATNEKYKGSFSVLSNQQIVDGDF